ncbi:methyl-accepting chemotaxis protein [Escherichia coli]|nr:methyl-accepting chemotaxis protein [Escherichia coli]RCC71103.1 methyl-accepting chemotaxis protein [Escherichia coli]RCC71804.1 methyl-accepting chemotaxis protein [Escherichia coli]RCF37998.1 methyl-accepting chemotaxis protein [Escherichia coli]TGH23355.1 methyl-accepting chemotaxis protein [Escherichia coli]
MTLRTPHRRVLRFKSQHPVTNGAIVIHTQRLKSDPGGNLLS